MWMGNVEVNAYIFTQSRDSNSKRRSYSNTNAMGKEFLELDSYCIVYYCPINTHIEMNGEYTQAYLNTYV